MTIKDTNTPNNPGPNITIPEGLPENEAEAEERAMGYVGIVWKDVGFPIPGPATNLEVDESGQPLRISQYTSNNSSSCNLQTQAQGKRYFTLKTIKKSRNTNFLTFKIIFDTNFVQQTTSQKETAVQENGCGCADSK